VGTAMRMRARVRAQGAASRRGLLALGAAAAGTTALAACTRSEGSGGAPPAPSLAPARLRAYISGTADTYRLLQEQQFPAFSERQPA
jgi:hypothetical protein